MKHHALFVALALALLFAVIVALLWHWIVYALAVMACGKMFGRQRARVERNARLWP